VGVPHGLNLVLVQEDDLPMMPHKVHKAEGDLAADSFQRRACIPAAVKVRQDGSFVSDDGQQRLNALVLAKLSVEHEASKKCDSLSHCTGVVFPAQPALLREEISLAASAAPVPTTHGITRLSSERWADHSSSDTPGR